MIDKTTIKDLCQKMAGTFKKFTTSACFMIAAAIMSVVLIHLGDKIDRKDSFFLMFWTITAGLLNLVVKLVLTDWRNDERHTVKPLWIIAVNALWLGVCLAFRQAWPLDLSWTNAAVTLVGIIVSGIFIAPVFQESNNDMRLWNYIIDCTSAFATAFAVGVLLSGGLELLVLAFNVLFGVEIGWKVYADVFLVCMIFVAPMVFMQLIPEKERHDTERPGTTGLGLINYLISPLFGTYVVTLYVYVVKILFEWKLPCGWVSTLVMASMICLILMMFLLYPIQFRKEDNKWRFDRKALKLLPAIFLPLLIFDGRNRQKDNGLRNHRATPIRSPLQRLGLCCLHRFDGQQMQKIPMDSAVLSSTCCTFVCWPAEFLSHVPKSPSQRSKESTIL